MGTHTYCNIITTSIGTHDIQLQAATQAQLSINSSSIRIEYSHLPGSTSTGGFLLVQSMTQKRDIYFIAVPRQGHSESTSTTVIIDNLKGELYNVAVYDLGGNQLPEVWPAGSQLATVVNTQLPGVRTYLLTLYST